MNPHLTAVFLAIYAGCALLGLLPGAVMAAKARQPVAAVVVLAAALFAATVLASGAADLW